ncbi:MAG: hypothetical protein U9Q97_09880 [Acidobacteriota bacterium]|nr:hypothetical protein [Acidobacteriota bacterium]
MIKLTKQHFIGMLIVIVVLSIAYHYVIYIPQRDNKNRIQKEKEVLLQLEWKNKQAEKEASERFYKEIREREARERKEANLSRCLFDSYDLYTKDWDNACEIEGKKESCNLPEYRAETLSKSLQQRKDNCYKQYK